MKLIQFLGGVAIYAVVASSIVSCQKNDDAVVLIPQTQVNERLSGVTPDDPALAEKVAMIVSTDFLMKSREISPIMLNGRGKPIKITADNTPPVVSITSPATGASVSGSINIQATASDNVGVVSVSFKVDGTLLGNDNAAPYVWPWNSATATNGAHTITVIASDAAGNTQSVSVSVTVVNSTPGDITSPTVSITSPTSGSSVSGTVNINATAADNVGISNVTFSVDGSLIGTDNSAPYSLAWNSSGVVTGIHTLTATARDAAGNTASYAIQVTVNTVVIPPGTLPPSYQILMPPVSNQGSEGSCVSFAIGYAARSAEQYYRTNASSYNLANNIFSPEFLYNQTKVSSSCGSGSSIMGALEFLKNTGICSWQSMPYSSANGCDLLPNASQTSEANAFKIVSYSGIYTSDLTSIKTMLNANRPLIISFALDQSFYNAGPGFIWSNYSSTNGTLHAVTICGYDDSKNAVKIMNSWGTGWGDSGYTWIDYNFLPALTNQVVVMNF